MTYLRLIHIGENEKNTDQISNYLVRLGMKLIYLLQISIYQWKVRLAQHTLHIVIDTSLPTLPLHRNQYNHSRDTAHSLGIASRAKTSFDNGQERQEVEETNRGGAFES